MEPSATIRLVTALIETFANGLSDYTAWRRKRLLLHHYRGRGLASPPCALLTTLAVSGLQIKETYDLAISIVGSEFSSGDCKPSTPSHIISSLLYLQETSCL